MKSASLQPSEEVPLTETVSDDTGLAGASSVVRSHRSGQAPMWLRAESPAWIWGGVAIAIAGFVCIAVSWGQTAGETQVYLQLPYVVSGGFVGLTLVLVGVAVLNIVTRQRDAIERDRQIEQLVRIMKELNETVDASRGSPS